jgi:hypothetical protein
MYCLFRSQLDVSMISKYSCIYMLANRPHLSTPSDYPPRSFASGRYCWKASCNALMVSWKSSRAKQKRPPHVTICSGCTKEDRRRTDEHLRWPHYRRFSSAEILCDSRGIQRLVSFSI